MSAPTATITAARKRRLHPALKQLLKSPPALLGAVLLATFVVLAVIGPFIAPYDPREHHLVDRFTPPFWSAEGSMDYPLGTDQLGRDVYSRLLHGARVALSVGLFGTGLALTIGVLLGLLAGFLGGWVDLLIMRVLEIIVSVPNTILYLTILGAFGPSLWLLIVVIGLFGWTTSARVVRGEVLSLRNREYVEASRALGQTRLGTLFKHVLPNVVGPIVVVGTLKVASIIILEASLSFLGFGVQPPSITWGQMLSDGRRFITSAWWLATLPGLAISLLTLSLLFLGNWLRDVLDPRTYD